MKVQPTDRDIIEFLMRKVEALEKRVKQLEESPFKYLPVYDSANFPADPVEGQVAIAPV